MFQGLCGLAVIALGKYATQGIGNIKKLTSKINSDLMISNAERGLFITLQFCV
jgi:hypothetical protein